MLWPLALTNARNEAKAPITALPVTSEIMAFTSIPVKHEIVRAQFPIGLSTSLSAGRVLENDDSKTNNYNLAV